MSENETPSPFHAGVKWAGLFAGPIVAWVLLESLPHSYLDADGQTAPFEYAGRATLALMAWMAIWWLTEAIELAATALLPLAVFPLAGVSDMKSAAAPYADPMIFLYMGGFLLALSMQRWGLDRRIALRTLKWVGTQPSHMVGGFMLVTAGLSAFVSNTATAAMMLPIAASVISVTGQQRRRPGQEASADASRPAANFAVCLMLAIAYSASIGGISTLIGTPPNVFLSGFLRERIAADYRVEVGFAQWALIGVPFALIFLPITWWLLTRVLFPIRMAGIEGGEELIESELRSLGRPNRGEVITLVVFLTTAMLWIFRPLLNQWEIEAGDTTWRPLAALKDDVIAITAAISLFCIPVERRGLTTVMDWSTANQLPWGILLLFGGGLSLAKAVDTHGVAAFLGSQTRFVAGMPDAIVVLAVITAIVFLTELTSNLATVTTLIPILAAMAPGLDVNPYLLIVPATIAASCAFMLPVATPPNAIVFGAGYVRLPQMIKAGFWLNLAAITVLFALTFILIEPIVASWR